MTLAARNNPHHRRRGQGGGAFSPANVAGLNLWYDASDRATLYDAVSAGNLVADNGAVARWEDKSGRAKHLTQSTAHHRPLCRPNHQNGISANQYDGIDDGMSSASALTVNGLTTMTLVCVCRTDPVLDVISDGQKNSCLEWNDSGGWGGVYLRILDKRIQWRFGTGQVNNNGKYVRPTPLNGAVTVTAVDKNGETERLYVGSSTSPVHTLTGRLATIAKTSDTVEVGTLWERPWKGYLLDCLVYNTCLSDADRAYVMNGLSAKWGIGCS